MGIVPRGKDRNGGLVHPDLKKEEFYAKDYIPNNNPKSMLPKLCHGPRQESGNSSPSVMHQHGYQIEASLQPL
jgi:hypothetical protein